MGFCAIVQCFCSPEGCFEELPSDGLVAAGAGWPAPVSREKIASISDRLSENGYFRCCASGGWVDGVFSAGFESVSEGIFSAGGEGVAAVALSLAVASPFPVDGGAGATVSAPPSMIGNPSLLFPTITIFELEDCAS